MESLTARSPRRTALVVAGIMICLAVAVLLLALGPPVAAPRVGSSTLAPTYEVGERVWVLRWPRLGWQPERGDVIVFPAPPSTGDREGQGFIKRIAGLPGERVAVRDGVLHVGGEPVDEPWRNLQEGPGIDREPTVVPDGHLFVLGDSRGDSYDSRHWGMLDRGRVGGVAFDSLGSVQP